MNDLKTLQKFRIPIPVEKQKEEKENEEQEEEQEQDEDQENPTPEAFETALHLLEMIEFHPTLHKCTYIEARCDGAVILGWFYLVRCNVVVTPTGHIFLHEKSMGDGLEIYTDSPAKIINALEKVQDYYLK
jgi:hypothetical protein